MLKNIATGKIAPESKAWQNKIVDGFTVSPKGSAGFLMAHREVLEPRHPFSGKLFRLEERAHGKGLA